MGGFEELLGEEVVLLVDCLCCSEIGFEIGVDVRMLKELLGYMEE